MRRIEKKTQSEDYKLIQNQILQTNMIRIVWLRVRKITDEILGVNGLNLKMPFDLFYTFSFSLAQQQQN